MVLAIIVVTVAAMVITGMAMTGAFAALADPGDVIGQPVAATETAHFVVPGTKVAGATFSYWFTVSQNAYGNLLTGGLCPNGSCGSLGTSTLRLPPQESIAIPVSATGGRADVLSRGASCSVNSLGLLPGQSRSCDFSATTTGGWRYAYFGGVGSGFPTATVTVTTRDGHSTTYSPNSGTPPCGSETIDDGDAVHVTLTMGSRDVTVYAEVGAGYGWGCAP